MKPEVFSALDKTHVPSPWNRVTEQHLVHQQHQQNHGNHRIIGYSGLEGTHQGHRVQLLTLHKVKNPTLCLRAILEMEVVDPGLKKRPCKALFTPNHSDHSRFHALGTSPNLKLKHALDQDLPCSLSGS